MYVGRWFSTGGYDTTRRFMDKLLREGFKLKDGSTVRGEVTDEDELLTYYKVYKVRRLLLRRKVETYDMVVGYGNRVMVLVLGDVEDENDLLLVTLVNTLILYGDMVHKLLPQTSVRRLAARIGGGMIYEGFESDIGMLVLEGKAEICIRSCNDIVITPGGFKASSLSDAAMIARLVVENENILL